MDDFINFIVAIIGLTLLCSGWVAIQYLARKMNTKNHFDDLNSSSCTGCMCGGKGECANRSN